MHELICLCAIRILDRYPHEEGRLAGLTGSDRGGIRAADVYTLIITAKLNNVEPRVWLADVLRRIAAQPTRNLADLLPWDWSRPLAQEAAAPEARSMALV